MTIVPEEGQKEFSTDTPPEVDFNAVVTSNIVFSSLHLMCEAREFTDTIISSSTQDVWMLRGDQEPSPESR